MSAPVYGVQRLEAGAERWAFTRDGVVLTVHRRRATAELQRDTAAGYLELMGRESHTVALYLSRLARVSIPAGARAVLPCIAGGVNHSADMVTVYTGAPEPVTVCGYHASRGMVSAGAAL